MYHPGTVNFHILKFSEPDFPKFLIGTIVSPPQDDGKNKTHSEFKMLSIMLVLRYIVPSLYLS
jgi:hypothetical protein